MAKRIALVVFVALGLWGAWVLGSAVLAPPDVEPGGAGAGQVQVADGSIERPGTALAADAQPSTGDPEGGAVPSRELARARPPGDAATGGLLVRVTWDDGTPAPHIAVGIRTPWTGNGIPGRTLDRVVSDEHGIARASHLPVGELSLYADRGARGKAEIAAGTVTEVDLKLEAGVLVEGLVVDGKGSPVADAAVWLTAHQPGWLAGTVVTRSGTDGSFALRAVPDEQSLGATAEGFAPSALVDLDLLDTAKSPVAVRLELVEPGGVLVGTVLSPLGKPVAGARVGLGTGDSTLNSRRGSTIEERWAPRMQVSDEAGRFRFASLPPGEQDVEVWSEDHPIWHGSATIAAGETTDLPVTLAAPVTVSGVVRDAAGEPVAGASVRAFPVRLDETFLPGGQFDYDSIFGYPVDVSDEKGRYRLANVPPGEIHAYAMEPRVPRSERTYVRDYEVLTATAGESIPWDPVLDPGHTIEGVVLYRDGEPLGNVFITAQDEETGKREVLHTGRDGRFRFVSLENHAHSVSVQIWEPPEGEPPVGKTGVWPDQGELRLMATWDKPVEQVPGKVLGSVHDAGGRLSGNLVAILQSDKNWWRTNPKIEGEAFRFDDVKPGRYKVVVLDGENPVHATDWFEVAPGEEKVLGTLITVNPGSLTLRIARAEGAESEEPRIYLRRGDSIHSTRVEPGTAKVHRVDNLTPGDYQVQVYGSGIASVKVPAAVTEGGNSEVEVRLRAAVLRELEIVYPKQPPVASFHVTILEAGGGTFSDLTRPWSAGLGNPWVLKQRLPLGSFTLRVETDTGLSGETAFSMESLEEGQPAVRLELK